MKKVIGILLTYSLLAIAGEPLDWLTVFSQPYLSGSVVEQIVWSPNDSLIAFLWNDQGGEFRNLWIANPQTGQTERLTNFNPETNSIAPTIGTVGWLTNRSLFFEFQGDIWEAGLSRGRYLQRFEGVSQCEKPISNSPDGKFLTYYRRGSLYLFDLTTQKEQKVTPEIRLTNKEALFACIDPTFLRWSHQGDRLAIYLFNKADDSVVRFKILNVKNNLQDEIVIKNPQNRGSIVRDFIWSPDDQKIVFESVTSNLLGRYLVQIDLAKSRMDTLYREEKNYFIADFGYRLFWIEPDAKILFGAENNSFNHLYTIDLETGRYNAVTRGKWNVRSYALDATGQSVYFTGTKDRRDRLNLYVTRLKTGETTNVSYRDGDYNFVLSNDGQKIAEVFSNQEIAPELYWTDAVPQSKMNRITTRPKAPVPIPECKTPKTGTILNGMTGREIYYRMWLPDGNLVSQKYPVLITLNSLDCIGITTETWRPESFFCQMMSSAGYVVVMVEYTPLKMAYEQSGKSPNSDPLSIQLSDIKAVLATVGKLDYVDLSRTGVGGWGYGGYLAAMAMFKEAATFRAGVAITSDLEWSQPEGNYLRTLTHLLSANNQVFANIDPQKYYHYLGGRFLVIQGQSSALPDLIEANTLIPDLLAKHKKVDFLFYPWENSVIKHGTDQYDLFRKTIRFFKDNL